MPNAGLELMTLRSRPELRSRVGHLTDRATQATPVTAGFLKKLNAKDNLSFDNEFLLLVIQTSA